MMGVETDSGERVLAAVKQMLREGVLALPDGPEGDVLALTPPFSINVEEIRFAVDSMKRSLVNSSS
jgi:4-aminobutyrate aminotransferase-like enzyme